MSRKEFQENSILRKRTLFQVYFKIPMLNRMVTFGCVCDWIQYGQNCKDTLHMKAPEL